MGANIEMKRVAWSGRIVSVQPRIRLSRSFDEWQHNYLGYVLRLDGILDKKAETILIGVGKGAHAKHQFVIGMEVSGISVPVNDQRLEVAGFYKTSRIKILSAPQAESVSVPTFKGLLIKSFVLGVASSRFFTCRQDESD